MARKINAAGLALVQSFEGLRLVAYDDLAPDRPLKAGDTLRGTLTIGHGHTGPDVSIGQTITKDQAARLLQLDLEEAERAVESAVKVTLNGNEFAALVSLTFNIGAGNLGKSTLLRRLNAGDRLGASQEFARWNKAGKPLKPLAGLTRRRAAEASLFLAPEVASTAPMAPTQSPDGVQPEAAKRTPLDIAISAAPAAGAALAGLSWPVVLILVLAGLAVGYVLWRRSRA